MNDEYKKLIEEAFAAWDKGDEEGVRAKFRTLDDPFRNDFVTKIMAKGNLLLFKFILDDLPVRKHYLDRILRVSLNPSPLRLSFLDCLCEYPLGPRLTPRETLRELLGRACVRGQNHIVDYLLPKAVWTEQDYDFFLSSATRGEEDLVHRFLPLASQKGCDQALMDVVSRGGLAVIPVLLKRANPQGDSGLALNALVSTPIHIEEIVRFLAPLSNLTENGHDLLQLLIKDRCEKQALVIADYYEEPQDARKGDIMIDLVEFAHPALALKLWHKLDLEAGFAKVQKCPHTFKNLDNPVYRHLKVEAEGLSLNQSTPQIAVGRKSPRL